MDNGPPPILVNACICTIYVVYGVRCARTTEFIWSVVMFLKDDTVATAGK